MAIGPVYGSWLSAARASGVDVDPVLRGLGYAEAQLIAPEMRLSPEADDCFGRELARRTQRPGLGIGAASRMQIRDLALFGYLLRSADDLAGVLALMQRYARLTGDSLAGDLRWEAGQVAFVAGRTSGRVFSEEMTDFVIGVALRVVRELTPRGVHLLEVRLPRTRPRDIQPFRAFFAAPIRFGAATGELVFREDSLTAPVLSADPVLARILREHADVQLSRLIPDAVMRERARAAVAQQGARGMWEVLAVARQLGMSPRTLRRRLQEEGTSFRTLVDDVRRERALLFAQTGRYNASEIAVKLGFADTTSLARAFRRWTGTSPGALLRQTRSTM